LMPVLPFSPSIAVLAARPPMRIMERLTAFQLQCEDYRRVAAFDTS
jgi:hypothetical protein